MDTVRRATVVVAITCLIGVVCAALGSRVGAWTLSRRSVIATAPLHPRAPVAIDQYPAADRSVPPQDPGGREHESPLDLYGNEVSDAFATYKLDGAGLLYEEHSPETEVPRLGAPKT